MKFRKHLAGVAAAGVVASAFATAAPALAVYTAQPDDPSFTPVAADLIGAGSDTTQIAVHKVAEGFNVQTPAPAFKIASFAATGGGTIPLPTAEITRPNGSGAGKALLHGAGNNPDVDFARSSGTLDDTKNEVTDGLKQIPFALDTLEVAVSGSTPSHAPATLTVQELVHIYDGTYAHWNDIPGNSGGSTAAIKPMVPQAGSGTSKFFKSQLDAANGSPVTYAGTVNQTVQEHDDTLIKNDADAIAPFSEGRANLLGGTVHLEAGFKADRAVYNVVRGTSSAAGIGLDNADIQTAFSSTGYFCSPAAKPLIEQGGLKQLLTPEFGGVCGQATNAAATNFATDVTSTTTSLTAASNTGGGIHLVATVSPSAAGTVQFLLDGTALGSPVQTQGGQATLDQTGLAAGAHTFKAEFTHDFGTAFTDSSSAEVGGTVKSGSTTAVAFSAAPSYGKATTIKATVTGSATGNVSFKVGSAAAVTKALSNGVATLVLPATKAVGTYGVTVTFQGTNAVAKSSATKSLVIAKAAPVISETFPTATLVGKPGKGVVKVAIAGSTVKPFGKVTIKMGTKVVKAAVSLVNGQVTITLPRLTKGKHTLTIVYSGSANVKAGSKSFTITQK